MDICDRSEDISDLVLEVKEDKPLCGPTLGCIQVRPSSVVVSSAGKDLMPVPPPVLPICLPGLQGCLSYWLCCMGCRKLLMGHDTSPDTVKAHKPTCLEELPCYYCLRGLCSIERHAGGA